MVPVGAALAAKGPVQAFHSPSPQKQSILPPIHTWAGSPDVVSKPITTLSKEPDLCCAAACSSCWPWFC
ncbi:hypothetical protein D0O09_24440 [Pseudomonas putida]|nr:hypothetical protein D0O09_24440 [Pseudomonas putida]